MDLVITASQSVLHLAGAMGVPCWVLTPSRPDWRLKVDKGKTTDWYGDHLRLYRQKADENWAQVIEWIAKDLREKVEVRQAA